MAKNECFSKGGGCEITLNEAALAYYGAALTSGEALEASELTGVALGDFTAATDGVFSVCAGFNLTVTGQDDGGAQAVAIGDPLYFHDTTGVVDKAVNGGEFIGWALATVDAQASTLICVLLAQDPDYTRFMDEQLLEFGDGATGKGGAGDVLMYYQTAGGLRWDFTTDGDMFEIRGGLLELITNPVADTASIGIEGNLRVTEPFAAVSLTGVAGSVNNRDYNVTGQVGGNMFGGFFQISLQDAGNVTGLGTAIYGVVDTDDTAVGGTLYCMVLEAANYENGLGGAKAAPPLAFIAMGDSDNDAGVAPVTYAFDIGNGAGGWGNVSTSAAGVGDMLNTGPNNLTAAAKLRVRINQTDYWILLEDTAG